MTDQHIKYGIEASQAPELAKDIAWIDGEGKERQALQLSDYKGKFKVLYGFQAWCPGCHSRGLPALKEMVDALQDNEQVEFFAIQTVFEGEDVNTQDKLADIQEKYDLKIPFGHDVGNAETGNRSSTMYNYRSGGTPWFVFIDQQDTVVFNDFHLNVEKAIEYLKEVK
ncbi:MAG: redoxin family protein [Bacteroidia bacterium]|nr:redoxin family protein [Bacteroidia bacterium]